MSSHTPGPWALSDDGVECFSNATGDFYAVTVAAIRGLVCDSEVISKRMAWANARLIAAAPDLLMACRMLVALEDGDVHDADTSWKQARKIMRSAIAKAEGGSA